MAPTFAAVGLPVIGVLRVATARMQCIVISTAVLWISAAFATVLFTTSLFVQNRRRQCGAPVSAPCAGTVEVLAVVLV